MPSPTSPSAGRPRALQLVDGNLPSPQITSPPAKRLSLQTSYPSPSVSTPTSSKRPASANPRRQSSISYFPSDYVRPLDYRSPTSPAFSSPTVRRSQSARYSASEVLEGAHKARDRRSVGSDDSQGGPPSAASDRGPLTLTEKHADLLRFIAQKESKCLELRSQLAVHEAELAELKRKWERIVSRGMDRAYSSPPASAPASGHGRTLSTSVLPTSLLTTGNGAVLDGIKEGVQEVGRLLAAGLELSSEPSSVSTTASPASAVRKPRRANTHSVSSVSTNATTSSTSSAQRFSQSSASSLSFTEEEPEEEDTTATNQRQPLTSTEPSPISTNVSVSPSTAVNSSTLRRRSKELSKAPLSPMSPVLSPRDDSPEKSLKRSSVGLPPPSSIPGLGPSSWMGSVGNTVGKKLGELQKGGTFTKSQKRASLLLSDVSQSIFAALSSPSATQTQSFTSQPSKQSPSTPLSSSLTTPHSSSLLEDDDTGIGGLGEVMKPNVVNTQPKGNSKPSTGTTTSSKQTTSLLDDDDDDWNW
ncbi:hypothetical protein K474DRAFT_1710539 [Panus rudis PR-1116 ss-1]|nr:hypothetical protein K474DRAFT_1710539 [Panus rudis PR-1116 ss-1]